MEHTALKEGEGGGPDLAYPTPVHLLTILNAASPGQCVWYTQPGQIPKPAAILTSKDQATDVIFIQGEDLPM